MIAFVDICVQYFKWRNAILCHHNGNNKVYKQSAAGYFLKSITNLDVAHFPERPAEPEVDFVLTIGEQRIPVEIKYRSTVIWEDTKG